MDDLSTRLREVRQALGLTQDEFASRLGFTRSVVTNSELRKVPVRPGYIQQVCKEYNVSQTWLETGEGQMFVQLPEDEQIAAEVTRILYKESGSFRARLISILTRLDVEDWEVLEKIAKELAEKKD